MDGTETRTSGGETFCSSRTAALKPKPGSNGPPARVPFQIKVGNKPERCRTATCASLKMQGGFYSLRRTTTDAAEAWYTHNLKGFRWKKLRVRYSSGCVLQARRHIARNCDGQQGHSRCVLRRVRTLHARTFRQNHRQRDYKKCRLSLIWLCTGRQPATEPHSR
jgi:hypothetical protein